MPLAPDCEYSADCVAEPAMQRAASQQEPFISARMGAAGCRDSADLVLYAVPGGALQAGHGGVS